MNAELVLNRDWVGVVTLAQTTVIINQELWHDEQRNAFAARWRIREPDKYLMNSDLSCVVIAPSDVNLLPENLVVVTVPFSAGLHWT